MERSRFLALTIEKKVMVMEYNFRNCIIRWHMSTYTNVICNFFLIFAKVRPVRPKIAHTDTYRNEQANSYKRDLADLHKRMSEPEIALTYARKTLRIYFSLKLLYNEHAIHLVCNCKSTRTSAESSMTLTLISRSDIAGKLITFVILHFG